MIDSFWEMEKIKGRRVFRRAGPGRSFVKNMCGFLYRQVAHAGVSMLDVGGTSRATSAPTASEFVLPQSGGSEKFRPDSSAINILAENLGIVVGAGTAAVAFNNYALATQIQHGASTGKLLVWGGLIREITISAPYAYYDISRIFENQSGGAITIKELGLQAVGKYDSYQVSFLICRDVLDEANWVELADTEILKVTYRIRVTV